MCVCVCMYMCVPQSHLQQGGPARLDLLQVTQLLRGSEGREVRETLCRCVCEQWCVCMHCMYVWVCVCVWVDGCVCMCVRVAIGWVCGWCVRVCDVYLHGVRCMCI